MARIKKNKKWSGFLINLLGVILGIMLTFGVNALWQKRQDNKKTQEILILVRGELKSNQWAFKSQHERIKEQIEVYEKVLEAHHAGITIPKDTLNAYQAILMKKDGFQFLTSAWRLFENSETLQKMTDKDLANTISACYFWIEKIKDVLKEEYWDKKNELKIYEIDSHQYFDAAMKNKEAYYFYSKMTKYINFSEPFFYIDAIIDYTLLKMDSRYDKVEHSADFNSFFKSRMDSINLQENTIQDSNATNENQK
jgi:hypothetical protein